MAINTKIDEQRATFGLHNMVVPRGAHKPKKLLGRGSGSGHGKTSTRGSKGQTSRAGRDFYAGFEGGQTPMIRRMPKRGFNNRRPVEVQIVSLGMLFKLEDQTITPDIMAKKGLIKKTTLCVKVLSEGDVRKAVTIRAHAFSKQAIEKIEKAGSKAEIIEDV
ncbi:MAG: 50S ribosomal protein L15 [Candidatus Omnitrophota bacterium]